MAYDQWHGEQPDPQHDDVHVIEEENEHVIPFGDSGHGGFKEGLRNFNHASAPSELPDTPDLAEDVYGDNRNPVLQAAQFYAGGKAPSAPAGAKPVLPAVPLVPRHAAGRPLF